MNTKTIKKSLLKTDIDQALSTIEEWKSKKITYELMTIGITNPNYKVTVDGKDYFLKIPGAGTEAFIDRDNCHQANIIGMETGIGPKVLYYFEDTGVEVWEWMSNHRPVLFGDIYDEKYLEK